MPFYPYNLREYIKIFKNNKESIPILEVKKITYGILTGLQGLHSKHWVHREINPHHILYNDAACEVAITGLKRAKKAKEIWKNKFQEVFAFSSKDYDVNDYKLGAYKPPEFIYGTKYYSYKADIWCKIIFNNF